jgi:ectoine hydroxylase-related dioxygenase (phytanoyl-CoA dioxygenase family)
MLTAQQVDQFQRDGCLNAGRVLSDDDITELAEQLRQLLDKGPDGFSADEPQPVLFHDMSRSGTPVWQIVNIWEACEAFRRLIARPEIVEGISQLTGFDDLQVWHDQVQYKPANTGGATTWHQDAPLWPAIRPMTPVSAWIPFDDADEDNGCMWMVPGSHRWGNQQELLNTRRDLTTLEGFDKVGEGFEPPADAPIREVRPIPWPVRRGELSFHHSLTWHGSPKNRSTRPRRAIAIHYMTPEAVFVAGSSHVMAKYAEVGDGEPMSQAGPHFPIVCRGGQATSVEPVPA